MAEFPCLPFFTDAYLGDTTHLTTIEHGAYLLLIITQWRSRDSVLPNDDKLLARYTKMTPAQWERIKPVLAPFFVITVATWYQKRLSDEHDAVKRKRDSNIRAGKVSALKRHERQSTGVPTPVEQVFNEPLTLTLNPKEKKKEEVSERPKEEMDKQFPWLTVSEAKKYYFCGKVIRLLEEDFMVWFANCSLDRNDFWKYLDERDEWLTIHGNSKTWFISTKADLEKRFKL